MTQHPSDKHNRQFYFKAIVAGVIVFLGVVGGLYTGSAFIDNRPSENLQQSFRNTTQLAIDDTLPTFPLRILQSSSDERELLSTQITAGRPTIFLFISPSCQPCELFASYWEKNIAASLRDDIKVAAVYNADDLPLLEDDGVLLRFPRAILTLADPITVNRALGISDSPTIVAVTSSGTIAWVSAGFTKSITAGFINETL